MYLNTRSHIFNRHSFFWKIAVQIITDDALTAYQKYVVNWDTFNPAHLSNTKNTITQVRSVVGFCESENLTNVNPDFFIGKYDALNRIRKAPYPADRDGPGKEMYPEYNKGGALLSLKMDGADYVKEVAYNARGQRILIAYGNKIMTRYAYDPKTFRVQRQRSALFNHSGHTYTPNAGIRQDLQYTYDLEGTITSINDAAPANNYAQGPGDLLRVFTHDPLRRLLSATGRETTNVYNQPSWYLNTRTQDYTKTNLYERRYAYDKIGNIQELKHTADEKPNQDFIRNYTYDSSHNKLKSFTVNSTTYINQYDANGSLTKEGESRYYEWGANDKLAVFKNQAGSSTPTVYTNYFYNAQGERVKKHTRKGNKIIVTFYMDGGMFETTYTKTVGGSIDNNRFYNTIKVSDDTSTSLSTSGALISTIRVGYNVDDSTPAIKYIVGDHLNNSSAVVKTTGGLINREEYYPFGETSYGSFQYKRYRYNGKEKDEESGLYEYGQRYYAPWLCRFVSVDPIAEDYSYYSPYNYAGNKPVSKVDLEGLQENDAKTDTAKESNNVNYKSGTSDEDKGFINEILKEASSSPLFNEVVQGLSDSKIPITIDTIDLDLVGFQAMFKGNLLDTEIPEGIEMGDDDTDSTWVVYPDPVEPTNTREYSGEITVNMSMANAGNVHEYGMELGRQFFLPAIIEEMVHAAQYSFYTGISDSNLKKDYPAAANIEVEAKIITEMILNQIDSGFNAISVNDEIKKFGENLNNDSKFDQNSYNQVLSNWMVEQKAENTIYEGAKGDFSSSPTFLINLLKR